MSENRQQSIRECLQRSDVQERIWNDMQEARSKATVTISRAANLFKFKESQLREWERRGLLQTERPALAQEGKEGHRQYSPAELDKLAIIRELINQGYSAGDIPRDVEKLWIQIAGDGAGAPGQVNRAIKGTGMLEENLRPIDKRVEDIDQQEAWRYFISQALRISLSLICQDIPDTLAGLILPLEDRKLAQTIYSSADTSRVGLSLVGWLGRNRSFYTFLDEAPSFEYPTDFRLETLTPSHSQTPSIDRVPGNVLIILQRKAKPLSLSPDLVETVQRILDLVYQRVDTWRSYFDYKMHDLFYQAHDLERASNVAGDIIFNALLERMIELGGKTANEQDRWSFCALLLPNDTSLPIQQQILTVRAQTRNSPYEIGGTAVNPAQTDSLGLKAFQSGQVVYFAETLPGESMTTYQLPAAISHGVSGDTPSQTALETSTCSAIAIPLLGEDGMSIAVLYAAANEKRAFSKADQRVLRVIARMVEELLLTSQGRRQMMGSSGNPITNPLTVDTTFRSFSSETDFIDEMERLLSDVQQEELANREAVRSLSIIPVDLDSQSSIAIKYGNRVARNLSQQIGLRIRGQMRVSNRYASGKLFHISADRYYFVLEGISLEETRNLARQLKSILSGEYRINPSSATSGRPMLPENMLEISGVTVHLSALHYPFEQLRKLLKRFPVDDAAKNVRASLVAGIEETLELGKANKGDCIITWDDEIWGWRLLD